MSTTSKKAPSTHEAWQDNIKTTEDQYRDYDNWVREEKKEEERIRKSAINTLNEQKGLMLKEKERNEKKEKILAESRAKLIKKKIVKEENIQKNKDKWWVKALNVVMGWDE